MSATPDKRTRRSAFHAITVVAVFVGALIANLREGGLSPIAWSDTFNDEVAVQECLTNDVCTLYGIGTSIPGMVHTVGWLEFRTLLAWLGLDIDGAHLVVQVCNALGVALVFDLTTLLSGRLAGAAAVFIWFFGLGARIQINSLYNTTPLLFLGAAFLFACTAVVERPSAWSVAMAALVGAILTNVHLACVLTGLSVVWVALLAPRRPVQLAAFGAAVFTVATFIVAPPGWLHDIRQLVWREDASGAIHAPRLEGLSFIYWALLATAAWIRSRRIQAPEWVTYRLRMRGVFAVLIPFLVPYTVAPLFGLSAADKYLAHVRAACCVAAAFPFTTLLTTMWRRLAERRGWNTLHSTPWLAPTMPFAVAFLVAVAGPVADMRTPTVSDITTVARLLHDTYGWNVEQMIQGVKTPASAAVLAGLRQIGPQQRRTSAVAANPNGSALFLTVDSADVPHPLPPNWHVVRQGRGKSSMLIVTASRIDWSQFEVCVQAVDASEPRCTQTGLQLSHRAEAFAVPNMPPGGPHFTGTLTLRLPLRRDSASAAEEIFMPRMPHLCGGAIVQSPTSHVRIDQDGRHGILSATDPQQSAASTLELEWHLGSPDCSAFAYDGVPPLVVAGDASTVRLVEKMLRKHEGYS